MRVAVVEDDLSYRELLCGYVERYCTEYDESLHLETFSDGQEIVSRYESGFAFDIILLDIEMTYLDGMEVAGQIRVKDEDVVFIYITNMAQYAVRGYEVEALDFIVKPVEYDFFVVKMQKAQRRFSSKKEKFIIVRNKVEIQKILMKDIIYIEVRNHSLHYHTVKNEYICSGNLKQVEREIESPAFSRCNSCYLVHLYHIKKVTKEYVTVSNGDKLSISRPRRRQFMEALTDYYGGR